MEPRRPRHSMPSQDVVLYEERLHGIVVGLQMVKFIAIYLLFVGIITIAWLFLVHAIETPPSLIEATNSGLIITYCIAGVFTSLLCYRAFWSWRHTILRMSSVKTGLFQDGSILLGVNRRQVTVPTDRIDNLNIKQSVSDLILSKVFGWNIWKVTIDTPATSDAVLHHLHYVKDGDRLENLFSGYRR